MVTDVSCLVQFSEQEKNYVFELILFQPILWVKEISMLTVVWLSPNSDFLSQLSSQPKGLKNSLLLGEYPSHFGSLDPWILESVLRGSQGVASRKPSNLPRQGVRHSVLYCFPKNLWWLAVTDCTMIIYKNVYLLLQNVNSLRVKSEYYSALVVQI